MGLKGTGSDTYTVTDMFIPARYSFTREFAADRRETGPLYRFTTYQIFGASFAGVASGIARATLDAFIQIAAPRSRCWRQAAAENAVVQSQVAMAEAKWHPPRVPNADARTDVADGVAWRKLFHAAARGAQARGG